MKMRGLSADAVRDWRNHGHGAALLAQMAALDGAAPESVLSALEPYLRRPDWLDELTHTTVAAMQHDPYYQPPFRVIRSDVMTGMIVADSGYIALAPIIIDATALRERQRQDAPTVSFAGGHSITYVTKSGGADITLFTLQAENAPVLYQHARRRITDGEMILCNDTHQSMTIHPGTSDLAMIRVYIRTPKIAPVREYCVNTGALIRMASNDDAGSRSQMMVTMLRHAAHPQTSEACALIQHSTDADTRWHAMREWLVVDAQAALPNLQDMAQNDPDAAVREAAKATLHILALPEENLCRA